MENYLIKLYNDDGNIFSFRDFNRNIDWSIKSIIDGVFKFDNGQEWKINFDDNAEVLTDIFFKIKENEIIKKYVENVIVKVNNKEKLKSILEQKFQELYNLSIDECDFSAEILNNPKLIFSRIGEINRLPHVKLFQDIRDKQTEFKEIIKKINEEKVDDETKKWSFRKVNERINREIVELLKTARDENILKKTTPLIFREKKYWFYKKFISGIFNCY